MTDLFSTSMIRHTTSLEIDEEELGAIIDFHRAMRGDTLDSCEYAEAESRTRRIAELEIALRRKVDWRTA